MVENQGQYLGHLFGHYRLVKLLSKGLFTEVYLGKHANLGTQAAIKILTADTPNEIKRFRNQACTTIELEHPNIVRIFDYGKHNGIRYVVMSYAPNGCLSDLYPQGTRFPLSTVVNYVKQIAAALQYLQEEGFTYRDIKPHNMLIGKHNQILLSNSSIIPIPPYRDSKVYQNQAGKSSYLIPEQIQEPFASTSEPYALGIIVYEWLCGKPPFEDIWYNPYWDNLSVTTQSLCEIVTDIPKAVEQTVMRALASVPEERFPDLQTFANALEEASKKPYLSTTLLRYKGHDDDWIHVTWSPDNKYLASCSYSGKVQIWDAINWEPIFTSRKYEEWVKAVEWSPDSRYVAFGSHLGEINVWEASSGRCLVSYRGHLKGISAMAWSSSGTKIASASENQVHVWDTNTGEHLFSYKVGLDVVKLIIWSPNEERIATHSVLEEYSESELIQVWDANKRRHVSSMNLGSLVSLEWLKDGERVITVSNENGSTCQMLSLWDASTGVCLLSYSGYFSNVITCTVGESKVAFRSGDKVRIWNASTGKELTCANYLDIATDLAWSPDGNKLVSGSFSYDGRVEIWNDSMLQIILTYEGHRYEGVGNVVWSPDGNRIASTGAIWKRGYTVQIWEASKGKQLVSYLGHSSKVETLKWSPDGSKIVSVSNDQIVRVWNSNTGKHLVSIEKHVNRITDLRWSLNGDMLISSDLDEWSSKNKTTHVWDTNTGEHLFSFVDHSKNRESGLAA